MSPPFYSHSIWLYFTTILFDYKCFTWPPNHQSRVIFEGYLKLTFRTVPAGCVYASHHSLLKIQSDFYVHDNYYVNYRLQVIITRKASCLVCLKLKQKVSILLRNTAFGLKHLLTCLCKLLRKTVLDRNSLRANSQASKSLPPCPFRYKVAIY